MQQQLHERMNDLVEGVQGAVRDADAATGSGGNRQVVDVGQSLTLLESKFANLRLALAHELGSSKMKINSHTESSKQLMERSTELVRTIINQRQELMRMSTDIRELDSSIRALRDGLHMFDSEMATMADMIEHLHQSHSDLTTSLYRITM